MVYREFDVPAALARHVRCVWEWSDPAPSVAPQTIYPDGCCELIAHLSTPLHYLHPQQGWLPQAPVLFAAQQRSAIRLRASAPVHCLGIRLQPAASAAVAGPGLAALLEQIVDLRMLDPDFAQALSRAAHRAIPDALWPLLIARIAVAPIDHTIEQTVLLIQQQVGDVRIGQLASALELSTRSLQTRFLSQVGLRAKEFARLLRLQALLRRLDSGTEDDNLAQLALAGGFADQAHATRELRRLTGQTPGRLFNALRKQKDGDEAVRLAAAFVRGASATGA